MWKGGFSDFGLHTFFCEDLIPSSVILFDILWFFSSCREWTGDLKKLPNIKLRKVSNKGLDTKNEEKEENRDADDHNEDDEDDNELDDMVLMSDWNRDWLNIQGNWLCWNVLLLLDCPEDGAPILLVFPRVAYGIAMVLSDFTQPAKGSTFIVYCTNKYASYGTWILNFSSNQE